MVNARKRETEFSLVEVVRWPYREDQSQEVSEF